MTIMKISIGRYIFGGLILIGLFSCTSKQETGSDLSRVIVITDINHCCGDPDDIQSLCHLMYYADELDIRAIIPDNFDLTDQPGGLKATLDVIEAYSEDYDNSGNNFQKMNFPDPGYILESVVMRDKEATIEKIYNEGMKEYERPLYVLIWGNMTLFRDALMMHPEIAGKVRVLTIGTNIMYDREGDGKKINWNAPGRNEVFDDPRFRDMWWVEMDWTYAAMFDGLEWEDGFITGGPPKEALIDIVNFGGALGRHMNNATMREDRMWANYFRVGDTPTVLYLIDPQNDLDDPSKGSWAGRYIQPFPELRPNYWTDYNGDVEWDYEDPANSWDNADAMNRICKSSLLESRDEMYAEMIIKLKKLYGFNE